LSLREDEMVLEKAQLRSRNYLNDPVPIGQNILRDLLKLPNILTLSRILLLPLLIYTLIHHLHIYSVIIGSVMLISDLFDGYLARRYKMMTLFGSILDPISDKLIVIALGIMLYKLGYMPLYLIWVLILRDFLILALGIHLVRQFHRILRANITARLTPFAWGIFYILLVVHAGIFAWIVGVVAIILTIISGLFYLRKYIILIRENPK
jgi:CDP-diacylglycerol--glycerol-3-phosphate 3-phosphatidyltransferase